MKRKPEFILGLIGSIIAALSCLTIASGAMEISNHPLMGALSNNIFGAYATLQWIGVILSIVAIVFSCLVDKHTKASGIVLIVLGAILIFINSFDTIPAIMLIVAGVLCLTRKLPDTPAELALKLAMVESAAASAAMNSEPKEVLASANESGISSPIQVKPAVSQVKVEPTESLTGNSKGIGPLPIILIILVLLMICAFGMNQNKEGKSKNNSNTVITNNNNNSQKTEVPDNYKRKAFETAKGTLIQVLPDEYKSILGLAYVHDYNRFVVDKAKLTYLGDLTYRQNDKNVKIPYQLTVAYSDQNYYKDIYLKIGDTVYIDELSYVSSMGLFTIEADREFSNVSVNDLFFEESKEGKARIFQPAGSEFISLAEYNRIDLGMYYYEVADIVGSLGYQENLSTEISQSDIDTKYFTAVFKGNSQNSSYAIMLFENGKLQAADQTGLK